jgi:hypothetical protein
LPAQDYARAVLACQSALTLAGLGELATVWPDDTADDRHINELSDQWAEANPWSGSPPTGDAERTRAPARQERRVCME